MLDLKLFFINVSTETLISHVGIIGFGERCTFASDREGSGLVFGPEVLLWTFLWTTFCPCGCLLSVAFVLHWNCMNSACADFLSAFSTGQQPVSCGSERHPNCIHSVMAV